MQLDFEKILEILFRAFDKNPPLWIGVGCLLIALMAFLIFRLIFTNRPKKDARKGQPAILNATQPENTDNNDNISGLPGFMNNQANTSKPEEIVLTIDDTLNPPISTSDRATQDEDKSLLEELSIPRPGTVPPVPKTSAPKRGLFNKSAPVVEDTPAEQASSNAESIMADALPESDGAKSNLSEDDLVEIERKLIALRELHDAGLIATEIYLIKSREFSRDLG